MTIVSAALPITQDTANPSSFVRAQPVTNPDGTNIGSTTSISSPSQAPSGIFAKVTAFGALNVSGPTTPLFNDAFNAALDTTNMWTLSGTTLPVVASGAMVASLGATNSVSSVAISKPSFSPTTQPILIAGQMNIGAAQTNPNCHRFFGVGAVTSYAAATPLTDGHGFEVDVTGALNAVVYVSGVRYVVNSTNQALVTTSFPTGMTMGTFGSNLTWPTTGIAIVSVQYFNGYAFFFMAGSATGFDVPIGYAAWIPAATSYPLRFAAITTPAVSTVLATTFTISSFIMGSIGGTNFTNSDPNFPWQQQAVDSSGRAAVISAPTKTTTATKTNVTAAAADTVILAAQTLRLPGTTITNDSTAILSLLLGATGASATAFTVQIDGKTTVPGSYTLPDGYTGAVCGYWASATGFARVTEMTA